MACLDQSSCPPRSAHFTFAGAGMILFFILLRPPSDICVPSIDVQTIDDAECLVVSHLFRIPLHRKRYGRNRIVRLDLAGGVPPMVVYGCGRTQIRRRNADNGMVLSPPPVDGMDDL